MVAWTAGVLPLRQAFGFETQAWTAADGRFVWLISYDGPGTFDEVDRRYYASRERRSLDPDPAQWIIDNETIELVSTATLDEAG